MTESEFKNILNDHTSDTFESFEKIQKGVMNHIYLITCQGTSKKYIIRAYPNSRAKTVGYEPEVLKALNQASVKSPKFIARSEPGASKAYMIYEYLPGRTLDDVFDSLSPEKQEALANEIVDNLLKIYQIQVEGFGPLVDSFKGSFDEWRKFVFYIYGNGINHVRKIAGLHSEMLQTFEASFQTNLIQNSNPKGLVWLDFHPQNIIVTDDGRLSGFIDFEEMLYGDIELALGYLYAREGSSTFYKAVIESYGSIMATPIKERLESFAIFRVFRIAPYLSKELPTGAKRDSLFKIFQGMNEINNRFEKSNRWSIFKKAFLLGNAPTGVSDNTQRSRSVWTLLLTTLPVLLVFLLLFNKYLDSREVDRVYWANEDNLALNLSKTPVWFNYQNDSLYADVMVTQTEKDKLFQNIPDSVSNNIGFTSAFSALVYKTRNQDYDSLTLIIACGLISVIGVQIRSLWDFVGNASYKNELSINQWWPWYVLRPFIGFMGAIVFYFLFTAGLFDVSITNLPKSRMYLLLGLSTIVGFGLNDFIERFRLISKAVIGGTNK